MNLKEFCNQYDVPIKLVMQFVTAGILDDLKTEIKDDTYGEEAVRRLEASICMQSLGFDVMTIKKYIFLELSDKNTRRERVSILQTHRRNNLEKVHKLKKMIDCIDYVLHEMRTNNF